MLYRTQDWHKPVTWCAARKDLENDIELLIREAESLNPITHNAVEQLPAPQVIEMYYTALRYYQGRGQAHGSPLWLGHPWLARRDGTGQQRWEVLEEKYPGNEE